MATIERGGFTDDDLGDRIVYQNPNNPRDFEMADGRMSHAALVRRTLEQATPGAAVELPLDGTLWPVSEMSDSEVTALVDAFHRIQRREIEEERGDWFTSDLLDWQD